VIRRKKNQKSRERKVAVVPEIAVAGQKNDSNELSTAEQAQLVKLLEIEASAVHLTVNQKAQLDVLLSRMGDVAACRNERIVTLVKARGSLSIINVSQAQTIYDDLKPRLGVSTVDNKAKLGIATVDAKGAFGAKVVTVAPGSAGEQYGLKVGDVVLTFNGVPISKSSDFLTAVSLQKPGNSVLCSVARDGEELDISLRMGAVGYSQAQVNKMHDIIHPDASAKSSLSLLHESSQSKHSTLPEEKVSATARDTADLNQLKKLLQMKAAGTAMSTAEAIELTTLFERASTSPPNDAELSSLMTSLRVRLGQLTRLKSILEQSKSGELATKDFTEAESLIQQLGPGSLGDTYSDDLLTHYKEKIVPKMMVQRTLIASQGNQISALNQAQYMSVYENMKPLIGLSVAEKSTGEVGARVVGLAAAGAGINGGLRNGDIIKSVNQHVVVDGASFQSSITGIKPGVKVIVSIVREGKEIPVLLRMGAQDIPHEQVCQFYDVLFAKEQSQAKLNQIESELEVNNSLKEVSSSSDEGPAVMQVKLTSESAQLPSKVTATPSGEALTDSFMALLDKGNQRISTEDVDVGATYTAEERSQAKAALDNMKPRLGLAIEEKNLRGNGRGIKVVAVVPGGSAAVAGIMVNDMVLEFNGVGISDGKSFSTEQRRVKAGDDMTFLIVRGTSEHKIICRMGAQGYTLDQIAKIRKKANANNPLALGVVRNKASAIKGAQTNFTSAETQEVSGQLRPSTSGSSSNAAQVAPELKIASSTRPASGRSSSEINAANFARLAASPNPEIASSTAASDRPGTASGRSSSEINAANFARLGSPPPDLVKQRSS